MINAVSSKGSKIHSELVDGRTSFRTLDSISSSYRASVGDPKRQICNLALATQIAVMNNIPNNTTSAQSPTAPPTDAARPKVALGCFPFRRPERQTRKNVVGPPSAATRLMMTPGQAGGHGEYHAHVSTSPT